MIDSWKPLRIVLGWQVVVTILLAAAGAWSIGYHAAVSALLGGGVAVAGGVVFTYLARPRRSQLQQPGTAWDGLARILKAEGAKVVVIVMLLWLVLVTYKNVVVVGFIGTFVVAVIIFSMAIFLRNPANIEAGNQHVN